MLKLSIEIFYELNWRNDKTKCTTKIKLSLWILNFFLEKLVNKLWKLEQPTAWEKRIGVHSTVSSMWRYVDRCWNFSISWISYVKLALCIPHEKGYLRALEPYSYIAPVKLLRLNKKDLFICNQIDRLRVFRTNFQPVGAKKTTS